MFAAILAVVTCLSGGSYSLWVALGGWERSQANRRAQMVVSAIGTVGARVFYFVLGLVLIALGVGTLIFGFSRA
jgi:hypothetical protein